MKFGTRLQSHCLRGSFRTELVRSQLHSTAGAVTYHSSIMTYHCHQSPPPRSLLTSLRAFHGLHPLIFHPPLPVSVCECMSPSLLILHPLIDVCPSRCTLDCDAVLDARAAVSACLPTYRRIASVCAHTHARACVVWCTPACNCVCVLRARMCVCA